MSTLEEIGARDSWRCWLCDLSVNADASVNDRLGPSIDRCDAFVKPAGKRAKPQGEERLAHRGCNTKKGEIKPVVPWPDDLILFDPAPIVQSVQRLIAKPGREVVARAATRSDAAAAGRWLVDRLSRLTPDVAFITRIDEGGGQFLLSLLPG
jgi:hypothetical protein